MWSRRSMNCTCRPSSRAHRSAIVSPKKPEPTIRRSAVIRQLCRYVCRIHRTPRLVPPERPVGPESAGEVAEALEGVLDDDKAEDLLGQRQRRADAEADPVE